MTDLQSDIAAWLQKSYDAIDDLADATLARSYSDKLDRWQIATARIGRAIHDIKVLLRENRSALKKMNAPVSDISRVIDEWGAPTTSVNVFLSQIEEQRNRMSDRKVPEKSNAQAEEETKKILAWIHDIERKSQDVFNSVDELIILVRDRNHSAASIRRVEVRVDSRLFRPADDTPAKMDDVS